MMLAHAMHWATSAAFFAPVVLLPAALLVHARRWAPELDDDDEG
jgi:hypothetical protein